MSSSTPAQERRGGPADPEWYRDAIIYELHVRSFQDSNGDGIGDFPGLIRRLQYLHDLGATALWLLPFYPSPLRDDGYDIAEFKGVHPDYGSMDDFRRFLDEAHSLGLRVISELVINHTSDEHPWFQRARTAPAGSPHRNFYVWSDSPEKYGGARIIFEDFERSNWTWDPIARSYYWHRFYSHQPDLNYDNPAVVDCIEDVLDFWFEMGVDGMRLDAVPYLVEREGTQSENLRPTHDILRRLRRHVDERFANRMFIAEANQWPDDAAAYFGESDESHMVFNFPLMPRLFMAIRQEDRLPIVDILAQTPDAPPGCQWALFLRNHDELTLEMVTEEERQFMYHVYATEPEARLNLGIRRRLAPLVGNDRRRIELINALLFSLPGTPVVYYGDEIGMGDNIYLGDRNGVRTPMQWSADRNAGFSSANPQRLFLPLVVDDEYHYQAVHVEQQSSSPSSLLSFMRRLIALRRQHQAFGRGALRMVDSPNPHIIAFVREWRDEKLLIVANLSRFAQHGSLESTELTGLVPTELFGRTPFPPVTEAPYPLVLSPHAFLWFQLSRPDSPRDTATLQLRAAERWDEVFGPSSRMELESALAGYLEVSGRIAGGPATILTVRIQDVLRLGEGRDVRVLLLLEVTFIAGEPEHELLPVGFRESGDASGAGVIAALRVGEVDGALCDATPDPQLASALFELVRQRRSATSEAGTLEPVPHHDSGHLRISGEPRSLAAAERGHNALMNLGDAIVLKLFRPLETGPHPEIEIGTYLNVAGFRHSPTIFASLHYRSRLRRNGPPMVAGCLQRYVPHQGNAWERALAAAREYASAAQATGTGTVPPDEALGPYADAVRQMARRVADLHRALAANTGDPAFAPTLFTGLSARSAYHRMRTTAVAVTARLRRAHARIAPPLQSATAVVMEGQERALAVFREVLTCAVGAIRIRCHGNLHLAQLLTVGDDLLFVDFEGEPGRPVYERRLKHSPLLDAASMIRSFDYAADAAIRGLAGSAGSTDETFADRARDWRRRVSTLFLETYAGAVQDTNLLPADPRRARALLDAYLLERTYFELGAELSGGAQSLAVPLGAIRDQLAST